MRDLRNELQLTGLTPSFSLLSTGWHQLKAPVVLDLKDLNIKGITVKVCLRKSMIRRYAILRHSSQDWSPHYLEVESKSLKSVKESCHGIIRRGRWIS